MNKIEGNSEQVQKPNSYVSKLLNDGTKCLLIVAKFALFSFWNVTEVLKIIKAKYTSIPLGLMTVAGLLPQNWEFKLIDENVESLLDEHLDWADIVCLGGMLPQQGKMVKLIRQAKLKGKPVVIGGPDPTSQPEIYKEADYLVLNEGEITIPMFLEGLKNGDTKGIYTSNKKADMNQAVTPRFDLINFKDYGQIGIQHTRGCPFNCEFCDIIELYGRKSRTKTNEQIIKELDRIYELGYRGMVEFVDDNFIGNKKKVKNLLSVLKEWCKDHKYPFIFGTEASLNIVQDEEIIEMMRSCEFRQVFIGIESSEKDILKAIQKPHNTQISIPEAVQKLNSYGFTVNTGFILGFDNETEHSAQNMIITIEESGIVLAMLGFLYALPNTQLTRRLKKEGRFLGNAMTETVFDQMSAGLNFIPTRPEMEILKDYIKILETIYHPKNYYNRIKKMLRHIKTNHKFKPTLRESFEIFVMRFLRLTFRAGFKRSTGFLYWKLIFFTLFKNHKAIERGLSYAAFYLHFEKQSKYIIKLTKEKIKALEKHNVEMHEEAFSLNKKIH